MKKWKFVRLPVEVYDELKKLGGGEERAFHEVITELLTKAKAKEGLDPIMFDKASWYSFKLVTTVTFLKAYVQLGLKDKVKEQLEMVKYVTNQIKERYGVETKEIYEVAKQYAEDGDKESMILLNEITKAVIKYIFMKLVGLKVSV